jgi:hypothetical protein
MSRKRKKEPAAPAAAATTSPEKSVSETTKWIAGIAAAIIGSLILFYIEKSPRPIMEVSLSFGDKPDWNDGTIFQTTPPPVSLIQGWSTRPEETFHVRMRNSGEVPLLDCQPFSSSIPLENGIRKPESLPFRGTPVNIDPEQQKEWDNMKIRLYTDSDQYEVHIICSCAYYDLFHIKRQVKYEESGVRDYRRPTLKSLPEEIDQIIQDKELASALKAKVEKAKAADFDDQIKILTDLEVQFQGNGTLCEEYAR